MTSGSTTLQRLGSLTKVEERAGVVGVWTMVGKVVVVEEVDAS